MRASVLDLGSNSFHVLVADVDDAGAVVPVTREREMLHLGRAVAEHGGIPDDLRRRAVATVARLTELADRTGATVHHAVATSALRDADNGHEVLAEMARAAGTPIRRIAGVEEARLGYLGVRAAIGATGAGLTVLDLGGGSLEVAIGDRHETEAVLTAPLGVSRLSALVRDDPPSGGDLRRLRDVIDDGLEALVAELPGLLPDQVVAVGGTVRAMARVVAAQDHAWTPATLNRLRMTTERLADLRDQLHALDVDDRADLPGMKTRRADHLHVAAEILVAVLERLQVRSLEVCDWGLREGVLLDAVRTTADATPSEVRAREVGRLTAAFQADEEHAAHTELLALQLFDATTAVHGLGGEEREVLAHASRLHDVGESLALRKHHKHGAYIIEHGELRGFTPGQTAMLVTLTRYHNAGGIKSSFDPYRAMTDDRRDATDALLALLQVADGLDRTRDGSVTGLSCERLDDDEVVLRLHGGKLHIARDELERRAALFGRTFGRRLRVVEPTAPRSVA